MGRLYEVADELLNYSNNDCLYQKKKGNKKTYATKRAILKQGKYFVLQNENSAPRVKFWLAIQDNDGDVGRRSFRKGL
jgi:hypothetical protein